MAKKNNTKKKPGITIPRPDGGVMTKKKWVSLDPVLMVGQVQKPKVQEWFDVHT